MKAIMRDEQEMKDSGIEWIGKIPASWNIERMKNQFVYNKGLNITKADLVDEGVAVISYGQIHAKNNTGTTLNPEFLRYISPDNIAINDKSLLNMGDIVFADTSEDYDGLGNAVYMDSDTETYAGYHTIIARLKNIDYSKYFAYLFNSDAWREQLRVRASGIKVFSVTQRMLNDVTLIMPEKNAIRPIISYLDDRCSKIDAIIAEAKASIEEYKELKISMVNDAITHGIKDNADTDSDVDWIGKIPANWRIMIMKRLFKIRKDIAGKEGYTVLSITQRGIVPKNFNENGQFAADYSNYQLVDKGDFAMNHMDLLTGWVDISEYDGVTSPDYRVFIPTGYEEIYKPYYKYVLQNCYSCKIFYGLGHGVAGFGRWRLPKDMFLNFKVPLPPIDEQKEIASYLDDNLQKLNDLILTKQSLIEDLEAYKKSLIYEVVTGKRKVVE